MNECVAFFLLKLRSALESIVVSIAVQHYFSAKSLGAEYLRDRCEDYAAKVLRACYPMDIYRLVKAISEYEGRPVRMTHANIDRAVALYFAKSSPKVE